MLAKNAVQRSGREIFPYFRANLNFSKLALDARPKKKPKLGGGAMGICAECGGRLTSYNVGTLLRTMCTNCRADGETAMVVRKINMKNQKIMAISGQINRDFERLLSQCARFDQNDATKLAKEALFAAYQAMSLAVKKNTSWDLF